MEAHSTWLPIIPGTSAQARIVKPAAGTGIGPA